MAKMLLILIGILSCVNAQEIDCYQVIPTIESMVREVSNSIVVEIELNEGTAVVQGSTHRLPLTQIVRVYHQNCCQNILMSSNGRCPTLNWRSLTNYLDFIAVLESQANMKFPSNEIKFEGSAPHQWTLKTSDQKRFSVNLLFRRYVENCCIYYGTTPSTEVPKTEAPEVPKVPAKLIASNAKIPNVSTFLIPIIVVSMRLMD